MELGYKIKISKTGLVLILFIDCNGKPGCEQSPALNVETSAYALLAILETTKESVATVLPIVRWIASQRNSVGGYYSTQVRL